MASGESEVMLYNLSLIISKKHAGIALNSKCLSRPHIGDIETLPLIHSALTSSSRDLEMDALRFCADVEYKALKK